MRIGTRRGSQEGLISASEIACFAYCREQWRLEYGLGLPAQNRRALRSGVGHHRRLTEVERRAGGLITLGRLLVALAVLGLLVLLMWRA